MAEKLEKEEAKAEENGDKAENGDSKEESKEKDEESKEEPVTGNICFLNYSFLVEKVKKLVTCLFSYQNRKVLLYFVL